MSSIDDFKNKISNHRGLAKPNRYEVRLPRLSHIPGFETDIEGLNLMCSNVNLPGKQILTADREIGIKFEKVPYGYAVDDISLTFYLTNDYQAKRPLLYYIIRRSKDGGIIQFTLLLCMNE